MDLFIRYQGLSNKAKENLNKLRASGVNILFLFNSILENINTDLFL